MLWGSVACPRRARTFGLGAGGCGPTAAPPCFDCCGWNTWVGGVGRRFGGCTPPPPNTGGKSPVSCTVSRSYRGELEAYHASTRASVPTRTRRANAKAKMGKVSERERGLRARAHSPPCCRHPRRHRRPRASSRSRTPRPPRRRRG
jgi:hypothetical protein